MSDSAKIARRLMEHLREADTIALYLADENERWIGPPAWHTTGNKWTYEYRLKSIGLLSAPILLEKS